MKCIHNNERISGLVVPLLSLRKNKSAACGVFSDLTELAKLAKQWGLSLIQLLPLNDTGNGTSPYSALSAFALHPIYISLPEVPKTMESLGAPLAQSAIDILKKAENKLARAHAGNKRVAFEAVLSDKLAALRSVWNESQEYCRPLAELFAAQETWAKPYACFMALKEKYGLAPWWEWPEYRDITPAVIETLWDSSETGEEARFRLWLQILAREQLKDAAHSVAGMSIDIMGDIPILLAKDSADVWYNRDIFILNSQAGAPPDMYSPRGQNWGFPLYNWDALKAGDYAFWRQRLAYADQFYTSYRIDHVLGFFRIWAISAFESEAFLGEFEPSERLARSELSALGFSDERITWLSKPHIPEWKIIEAEAKCIEVVGPDRIVSLVQRLDHLRQACFARIKNEPLFLFSPQIRGSADINSKVAALKGDFPQAASALSDYAQSMCEWWTDRALYEVEPDRFVFTWEYHNTTSWKSLSVQEQEALEQKAAELASKSLAVWESRGRELLSMLVASTGMQPFAEDLGAVPPCVPKVLKELKIPGLRVLRWEREWDKPGQPYIQLEAYEPLSVACTSVHDSSSMRQWWEEEADRAQLWAMFKKMAEKDALLSSLLANCSQEAPEALEPSAAAVLVRALVLSASNVVVYPLQDILACHPEWREPDARDERINVPGTTLPSNWSYRVRENLRTLASDKDFAAFVSRIAVRGASE
jgi:4-alpha-glucanotransferase